MADNSAPSFDKWRDGISAAVGDDRWNSWDNEVQLAVSEFNHHLIGNAGYRPLDWRIIKAMTWVESGANSSEWKKEADTNRCSRRSGAVSAALCQGRWRLDSAASMEVPPHGRVGQSRPPS
jgi:hypothetical protein